MTLTMCCKIVFHKNERRNEIILHKVNSIEFTTSFKEPVSRGSLEIPRNISNFDRKQLTEAFKRGDALTIYFGYNNKMIEEFVGYISRVSADIPVKIDFEDEMFKIKQIPVNFSSKSVTLKSLLNTIVPGYEVNVIDSVNLGTMRLAKTQVGSVLEKLTSDWGLYTYMKGKTLVCGKYFSANSNTPKVFFNLERNCVSTSLNYKHKDEILVRVKAISTLHDGKKISVENIGDPDGDERQLSFYNITSESELKKIAQSEYERFKQDRLEGSFTVFGTPSVTHGIKVELKSNLYTDRNGTYYVESVNKVFDTNGIRQIVTLGDKI